MVMVQVCVNCLPILKFDMSLFVCVCVCLSSYYFFTVRRISTKLWWVVDIGQWKLIGYKVKVKVKVAVTKSGISAFRPVFCVTFDSR